MRKTKKQIIVAGMAIAVLSPFVFNQTTEVNYLEDSDIISKNDKISENLESTPAYGIVSMNGGANDAADAAAAIGIVQGLQNAFGYSYNKEISNENFSKFDN